MLNIVLFSQERENRRDLTRSDSHKDCRRFIRGCLLLDTVLYMSPNSFRKSLRARRIREARSKLPRRRSFNTFTRNAAILYRVQSVWIYMIWKIRWAFSNRTFVQLCFPFDIGDGYQHERRRGWAIAYHAQSTPSRQKSHFKEIFMFPLSVRAQCYDREVEPLQITDIELHVPQGYNIPQFLVCKPPRL